MKHEYICERKRERERERERERNACNVTENSDIAEKCFC